MQGLEGRLRPHRELVRPAWKEQRASREGRAAVGSQRSRDNGVRKSVAVHIPDGRDGAAEGRVGDGRMLGLVRADRFGGRRAVEGERAPSLALGPRILAGGADQDIRVAIAVEVAGLAADVEVADLHARARQT